MHRIFTFLTLLLAGCSELPSPQQLPLEAARSDSVWLCDVDVSGARVRYKTKEPLKGNASSIPFLRGQILPVSGPPIEPGHKYGDEAIIFLAKPTPRRQVAADLAIIISNGVTGQGMSRDEVIRIIRETQAK